METVTIQINNAMGYQFLQNLEALDVIKVLQNTPKIQLMATAKTSDRNLLRAKRLERIKAITKNISVDLANYRFNREEANNYDE
ncbi:MAG: hypothetical protein FWG79_02360 [Bacteroidales bacterium]|nr:hypothetical protein [Bacteroidales bacterium]